MIIITRCLFRPVMNYIVYRNFSALRALYSNSYNKTFGESFALMQTPLSIKSAKNTFLAMSTTNPKKIVAYEELKLLTNDKTVLVIDVREPSELHKTGVIPGSINIPCEIEKVLLSKSADEFSKQYGRSKPNFDVPLIFSCLGGIRSEKASNIATKLGYKNVRNFRGGWNEWAERSKEI